MALLLSRFAFAATPRDTEVGSEEERLRRPKKIEVPERPSGSIEVPPPELSPVSLPAGPRFVVKRVAVEGSTLISDEELKGLTGHLVATSVTFEELRGTAEKITRWYRARGYVTSRAFVPAQTVEEGLVRIRVIEGKVGGFLVQGNRFFSSELLSRQLKPKPGKVLQIRDLEDSVRHLNSHPDRKVKLILVPGTKPETTDLILQVKDQRPMHASYGVDTLGTKTTGLIRQSLIVAHGNLTGRDDQMVVRGIITEGRGLWGGTLGYLRPVTESGVTATFDVSGVKSSVGGDLKNLLARGDAVTLSPGMIVPLYRRANWELESVSGFDWKRIRTRRDEVTTSKDDLRVAHLGTNLLEQDSWGQGLFIQELRVGIPNILGGSHPEDPAASRTKAGGSFVRFLSSFARVQQGPFGLQLLVRGSAQMTTKRLVPAEQFRLGGFDTVRGYPEGHFLADSGYQATVELRAPLERFLSGSGNQSLLDRLRRSLLLVAFWDFAEGFVRSPAAGEDADERLAGVGCGFRLRPTSESILQADFGWRIGDADSEKDQPRIHLICRIGF